MQTFVYITVYTFYQGKDLYIFSIVLCLTTLFVANYVASNDCKTVTNECDPIYSRDISLEGRKERVEDLKSVGVSG